MTLEQLFTNAIVFGRIPLKGFIASSNKVPVMSADLKRFYLFDLSKMSKENREKFIIWILTINKEKIEAGESVIITREMLSGCPLINNK